MKCTRRRMGYWIAMSFLLSFLPVSGLFAGSQDEPPPQEAQEQPMRVPQPPTEKPKEPELGEDPGPVFTQMVRNWAQTTNFAKNAADVAIGKLKLDIERDPKLKRIMSRELMADLEQFYYELFISPETMTLLAKLYSKYFTLDEMQELINFYKSPLGQKLVKNNTEITLKTQEIGMYLLKEHEKEYMKVVSKYLAKGRK